MIEEAINKGRKVHFASLMDICHLENSELELQYQKYKGRVALREDIVKDDSGSCAVFTEQGSSASQMTAAKVMADAVSGLMKCSILKKARKLRDIYFIDPEDKEFKETIKSARKKLETSVAPAMPCKIMKKNCWSGASNKIKTRLACILEASDSTRLRMGESLPNHHEDHMAGKGNNSLQHYNLVHKFIPVPQAMKNPAAKAAVDKEWEKLEKISAWNLTKVKNKKEVIDEARDEGRKSSFCLADAHLSFEECRIGDKAPKIQRSSCTPR